MNGIINDLNSAYYAENSTINSYSAKAKYRFGDEGIRFFVGLMAGIWAIKPGTFYNSGNPYNSLPTEINFGIAPLFGVQFGRFFQISTSIQFPAQGNIK